MPALPQAYLVVQVGFGAPWLAPPPAFRPAASAILLHPASDTASPGRGACIPSSAGDLPVAAQLPQGKAALFPGVSAPTLELVLAARCSATVAPTIRSTWPCGACAVACAGPVDPAHHEDGRRGTLVQADRASTSPMLLLLRKILAACRAVRNGAHQRQENELDAMHQQCSCGCLHCWHGCHSAHRRTRCASHRPCPPAPVRPVTVAAPAALLTVHALSPLCLQALLSPGAGAGTTRRHAGRQLSSRPCEAGARLLGQQQWADCMSVGCPAVWLPCGVAAPPV